MGSGYGDPHPLSVALGERRRQTVAHLIEARPGAGDELRTAAWDRLAGSSAEFRRYEDRFSLISGLARLTECVLRMIAAFTLSPSTMAWLSDALLFGGIAVAVVISGGGASSQMEKLVDAETAAA